MTTVHLNYHLELSKVIHYLNCPLIQDISICIVTYILSSRSKRSLFGFLGLFGFFCLFFEDKNPQRLYACSEFISVTC